MQVLKELESNLNFSSSLVKGNGSWSRMIGMVNQHQVDFSAAAFSQTLKRVDLVDFSIPLTSTFLRMFYPVEDESIHWLVYLKSFQFNSWLGLLTFFWTIFLLFASMAYMKDRQAFSIRMAFAFTALSQIGKRFPVEPDSSSLRLGFFCISFCGFTLISLYRAMLGASMAIKIYHEPVSSLEDLLASDWALAVSANSSIQEYFSEAPPASVQGKLWRTKLTLDGAALFKSSVKTTEEIALGIRTRTILFGVFQSISTYGDHYPCQIQAVKRNYREIDNGMVYPKKWPFTRLFNHHLVKLRQVGLLQKIRAVYLDRPEEDCGLEAPRNFGILNMASLGILLFLGFALSLAIFLCELFC